MPGFSFYHSVNQYSQEWPKYDHFIAKTWSSHGPSNGPSWILINVQRDAPCQISLCWLNLVAPFPRNVRNSALLWPKHGPCKLLEMYSSWILINVPRDTLCQISHFRGYPVLPFSYKWPKSGPNMVLIWSLKLVPRYAACKLWHCVSCNPLL